MTVRSPSTHRAQMSTEDFEQVARAAPETVTFEFINGRVEVKPATDGDHGEIFMWLLRQCLRHRPELALYPKQGLAVETFYGDRARPDGALAPVDHFAGQGEWSDPTGVLMALEVTSYDYETNLRDRVEKRDGYAAAGIPVYLLIDRDTEELAVYSDLRGGVYESRTLHPYGATVKLPHPVSITLETEKLKDYTR
ncbi:Uma2 family endonuclease [Streptomyces sp. NPDC088400]|uniref:Uma2 family endonuclease n=1 Tax=Streptomyces sp. NPDC088400 TaxID=3365861 RepID=UPI0037F7AD94